MRGEAGCLMLYIDFKDWEKCLNLIPDEMVFNDETKNYGKENEPHTTILFGFDKEKTDIYKIKEYITILDKSIEFNIVGISTFNNPNFTVFKFDVESEELNQLNKYFKDNFQYKNDHPLYHPHITISYIKNEYQNDLPTIKFEKGFKFKTNKFKYSDGTTKEFFKSKSEKDQ